MALMHHSQTPPLLTKSSFQTLALIVYTASLQTMLQPPLCFLSTCTEMHWKRMVQAHKGPKLLVVLLGQQISRKENTRQKLTQVHIFGTVLQMSMLLHNLHIVSAKCPILVNTTFKLISDIRFYHETMI